MVNLEGVEKAVRSKFFYHARLLIWKSATQRRRKWRPVLLQLIFAALLFLAAVMISKPVFLTPVREQPQTPITFNEMIGSLNNNTYLGFSPYVDPYVKIMEKVALTLNAGFMTATTEQQLNDKLYAISRGNKIENVIWVLWQPKVNNTWSFTIRCSELVALTKPVEPYSNGSAPPNKHLRVGFLAVQLAVSEAILDEAAPERTPHQIILQAMPTSPLMNEKSVRNVMALILLCFTVAFVPPVMELSALVVKETENGYKRAMRIRNVDFSCLYIGWLTYALITALPACVLASVALIFMFRWILLFYTLLFVLAYFTVMTMLSLIMSMFHSKPYVASIWQGLFSLLQLFMAELLVHHNIDVKLGSMSFCLHVVLPPLGLVHGFNSFALLQTGRGGLQNATPNESTTITLWVFLILFYFAVLMLLQRTIGRQRAIGGQVSWKSIIFKKATDANKLRYLHVPTGKERDQLQEVDECVAKAISFRHVTKSIMGVRVLNDINLDFYRGEYTMLLAERVQSRLLNTIEDLITGLTHPDKGVINVLGQNITDVPRGKSLVTQPGMIGYCHRSQVLIQDFSVLEHLQFFTEISMWDYPKNYTNEYFLIKSTKLLEDCDLEGVCHENVKNLDPYYHAQLCWAIALIMEPRIIYISNYLDELKYISVINDKILKTRGHQSVIKIGYATYWLHQADRVFYFDNQVLVFGGTPRYMFFKFGREYRVRMTVRCQLEDENVAQLLRRAAEVGARVRAHLGSLLILRMPTAPTDKVAAFVKDISDNATKYGITTLNISMPDSEESNSGIKKRNSYERLRPISRDQKSSTRKDRRAIVASRSETRTNVSGRSHEIRKAALERTAEPRQWKRKSSWFLTWSTFKEVAWKFICFYVHYRFYFIITIVAAIVTGVIIGVSLAVQLTSLQGTIYGTAIRGERLAVEALPLNTTLVVNPDSAPESISIANAYVLSSTNAKEIHHMNYIAIPYNESVTAYLMLRAIDSPQKYVYMYAYGMAVTKINGILYLKALYSPIHQDTSVAARTLARLYMALLRHYSGKLDADIQVTDSPLLLDAKPELKEPAISPIIIQFMLIITISHITLLPSKEHGLIRHLQAHAWDFSPVCYWTALFLCDLIMYWALVFVMSSVLFCVVYIHAPTHVISKDLIVIPFVLIVYGLSCVPQAYLFSLGPSSHVNSMTFIIVNVIFGESTVLTQLISNRSHAERFLAISPQYNVATAFIRLTEIFVHNSECIFLNSSRLCTSDVIHRCCKRCGLLQPCFKRIPYFSRKGILSELVSTLMCGLVFSILLALWEYQAVQRLWKLFLARWLYTTSRSVNSRSGSRRFEIDLIAENRKKEIRSRKKVTNEKEPFGEYLLVHNVSKRSGGSYLLKKVSFGIGKGQALALAGLKRHGRLMLGHMLAGYKLPSSGDVYIMSKWNLACDPHRYSRNVSMCFFESSVLPPWMTVSDALSLIAVLRGVPTRYVRHEVADYIEALELQEKAHTDVSRLQINDVTRLNFAAAAVGAPPVLVLDECTAYQKFSVNRAMYYILYNLRKRGHAIFLSSANVESHMPVTNQLAFLLDGQLFDIDHVDDIVARYSQQGHTVVVQLKTQRNPVEAFGKYFHNFTVNDTNDVLASVQILDGIDYAEIFQRMEKLLAEHEYVLSYVISAIPLDFIYNKILVDSEGLKPVKSSIDCPCWRKIVKKKPIIEPAPEALAKLEKFEEKYDILTLKELPWSVIFETVESIP